MLLIVVTINSVWIFFFIFKNWRRKNIYSPCYSRCGIKKGIIAATFNSFSICFGRFVCNYLFFICFTVYFILFYLFVDSKKKSRAKLTVFKFPFHCNSWIQPTTITTLGQPDVNFFPFLYISFTSCNIYHCLYTTCFFKNFNWLSIVVVEL